MPEATATFADVLRSTGLIAILRGLERAQALRVANVLVGAGVRLIEIALSRAEDVDTITALRDAVPPGTWIGAGTVTDLQRAARSIACGAQFFVTPHVALPVLEVARSDRIPVVCGAATPTEIALARDHGARFIKLFPAAELGAGYLRALLGPYPDLEIVAVGGIRSSNLEDFLEAGAVGAGVGGALCRIDPEDETLENNRNEAERLLALLSGRS